MNPCGVNCFRMLFHTTYDTQESVPDSFTQVLSEMAVSLTGSQTRFLIMHVMPLKLQTQGCINSLE